MNKLFFILIHLGCLCAFLTGCSTVAIVACVSFYLIRMFAITAGYHRYFSHRSFETSRIFQFILAFIGASSAQKGPLWWAASHRHHHKFSDTEEDIHSPGLHGVWWAHVGWVMSPDHDDADLQLVRDLSKFWELRLLEKYHFIPPLLFLFFNGALGAYLNAMYPSLGTSALQMMGWGALVSTVVLYHATFAINSLAHVFGSIRFKTGDESKNSFWLALVTLGEGWHNNHHRYPGSEKQGFYWWEIDLTHYVLKLLSFLGIVWNLRVPPQKIYQEALLSRP